MASCHIDMPHRKEVCWKLCSRHPDTGYNPHFFSRCVRCEVEFHQAIEDSARERRISEVVEIARRIIPLVIAALDEYDAKKR